MQSFYVKCRNCESELEHAGDYCMVCNKVNTHLLGVYIEDETAHLFCFYDKEYVGEEIVKLLRFEIGDEVEKQVAYRNSIELISEAIHRKRPEKVIVSGINPKEILQLWNAEVYYTDKFETAEEFKKALKEYLTKREIEKVDIKPEKKLGGRHTTVIGGRSGWRVLLEIASSPYVKKIIACAIEVSGKSGEGFQYKIQKPDRKGNLRVLLREGSAVQEIRIITTAYDERTGEKVREEIKHRTGYDSEE